MQYRETITMALITLRSNKLRSLLTMLGIIIGVASVIAMLSIGLGVRKEIQDSISSLGSNMLIIRSEIHRGNGNYAAGIGSYLKISDAEAISKHIPDVEYVSPMVIRTYQVINGNNNWQTQVVGVEPSYMQVRSLVVNNGVFINQDDLLSHARVAVIGPTVAQNLFPNNDDPVGQMIRINNSPYRVIGITAARGQSGFGQDQDDVIYIPLTTAMNRLMGLDYVQLINVQVQAADKMQLVEGQIKMLLRQTHHLPANVDDDFSVQNLTALLDTMNSTTAMITVLLASIAGISLLVGGIGIMNIMLVSVTERTREIGVRKALGATYYNIMVQFLIEALFIGIIGGLIGIACGCTVAILIGKFTEISTLITASPIIVAFVFAVVTSVFFGLYPARRAAKLDPIEALRYE